MINKTYIQGLTVRQRDRIARKVETLLESYHAMPGCMPKIRYDDLCEAHRLLTNRRVW